MMKNILIILCCIGVLFLTACKDSNNIKKLSKNEVYFFYQQGCPHCEEADKYISENYHGLAMKKLDIATPGNRRLFESAVRKYKISGTAGTPLICFGKNYIMGWSVEAPKELDIYLVDYQ